MDKNLDNYLLNLVDPTDVSKVPDLVVKERQQGWDSLFNKFSKPFDDDVEIPLENLEKWAKLRPKIEVSNLKRSSKYEEFLSEVGDQALEVATEYGTLGQEPDEEDLEESEEEEEADEMETDGEDDCEKDNERDKDEENFTDEKSHEQKDDGSDISHFQSSWSVRASLIKRMRDNPGPDHDLSGEQMVAENPVNSSSRSDPRKADSDADPCSKQKSPSKMYSLFSPVKTGLTTSTTTNALPLKELNPNRKTTNTPPRRSSRKKENKDSKSKVSTPVSSEHVSTKENIVLNTAKKGPVTVTVSPACRGMMNLELRDENEAVEPRHRRRTSPRLAEATSPTSIKRSGPKSAAKCSIACQWERRSCSACKASVQCSTLIRELKNSRENFLCDDCLIDLKHSDQCDCQSCAEVRTELKWRILILDAHLSQENGLL